MDLGLRSKLIAHPRMPALQDALRGKQAHEGARVAREIAREMGVTAGSVKKLAENGGMGVDAMALAGVEPHKQAAYAAGAAKAVGFGGTTAGSGLGGPLGMRAAELSIAKTRTPGVLPGLKDALDGLSQRASNKALADGKVELHEVWNLIQLSRDHGAVTNKERQQLLSLLQTHSGAFTPLAAQTLTRFLQLADPSGKIVPQAHASLRALWTAHRGTWNPPQLPPTPLSAAEAKQQAQKIFSTTPAQGRADASDVAAFFRAYPSNGAEQIVAFHNQWATWETLDNNPLQGFLYHTTRPFGDGGKPRGPLWAAYTLAVETGAPGQVVEEAFLHAHIEDFKAVLGDPRFQKLLALAEPSYRKVVEAYLDALQRMEGALDGGKDPVAVSRSLTPETFKTLIKRGTVGMMWTPQVFTKSLDLSDPNTRAMWGAMWKIAKNTVLGVGVNRPQPRVLQVELTATQAQQLNQQTGMAFKPGQNTLTPDMFRNATFAEPERRHNPTGPARRYPLRFEDFTADRKMRPGLRMAGADGVLQFDEIQGALRRVQARVRSALAEDFHRRYPVPQGGILAYSANMLTMNGTYTENTMFGALPNSIMPVDNDGKPKNALWQAYVDAYEAHKSTGAPAMEKLELLWLKAHMEDFKAVDAPQFQEKLNAFWEQAALDPVLAPMAIYTKAMLLGRLEFDKATTGHVRDEVAFSRSLRHFGSTMMEFRTFPFWQQDMRELSRLLFDPEVRGQPDVDDRGLATDKALIERAVSGIKDMMGLGRIVAKGVAGEITGDTHRIQTDKMVDLSAVLTPKQLAQVDPMVVKFYENPTNFNITCGVDMPWLNRIVMGGVGARLSGQGDVPDQQRGFEGFPLEMDLYKDPKGHTHWDRYAVVNGRRRTLFTARFEVEGKQIKETFSVRGRQVALYFDAEPANGGLRLSLDPKRSSMLARGQNIVFNTHATAQGLRTTGDYTGQGIDCTGSATFEMRPK